MTTDVGPDSRVVGSSHAVASRLRVPSFAVASTVLAAVAHVGGGGTAPSAGLLGAGLAAATGAGAALAVRERGLPMIAGAVAVVQVVLHVLWEPGSAGAALPPGEGWHTAHGASGAVPMPGPAMIAAHVLAALLVAVWLRRGEPAVHRWVRSVLGRVDPPLPARPVARALPVPSGLPPVVREPLRHSLSRRGPPRAVHPA